MTITTNAIVIGINPRDDKSSRVSLYTRANGRNDCILFGKKLKPMLTPMSIVEVTLSGRNEQVMPSISSVSTLYVATNINTNVEKQCIAMFMAEVLNKTLRLPMADIAVYDYLEKTVKKLDTSTYTDTLPTAFLTQLSELLGYGGELMEEWRNLKSMEVIDTILNLS